MGNFSSQEAKMCEQPIPFWSESEVGRPAGQLAQLGLIDTIHPLILILI